jgi:translation initiation factor IF-3
MLRLRASLQRATAARYCLRQHQRPSQHPPAHHCAPALNALSHARAYAAPRKQTPAPPSASAEPQLNEAVARLPRVRLISEDGADRGEMSGRSAVAAAQAAGRDVLLVQSAPKGGACVVRLVDYAAVEEAARRKAYAARKKKREVSREDRKSGTMKQVRLSPSTGDRDFEMKMRQARKFLLEGYRVRVFMMFRRGQGRLHEDAKQALSQAAALLTDFGVLAGAKKLRGGGGGSGTSVDELFPTVDRQESAAPAAAGAATATATAGAAAAAGAAAGQGTRPRAKPLEVLLMPMKRADRDRIKVRLELGAGGEDGGREDDDAPPMDDDVGPDGDVLDGESDVGEAETCPPSK